MSEKSTENLTTSDSSFAATFVDHHVLRNTNFNEYCLIKNNFSIPKVINLYVLQVRSPIKKFKQRYYIK